MGIRGLLPFAGRSPDPNPCMLFIANIRALEISVLHSLRLGIKIDNAQTSVSNLHASHDSL